MNDKMLVGGESRYVVLICLLEKFSKQLINEEWCDFILKNVVILDPRGIVLLPLMPQVYKAIVLLFFLFSR